MENLFKYIQNNDIINFKQNYDIKYYCNDLLNHATQNVQILTFLLSKQNYNIETNNYELFNYLS